MTSPAVSVIDTIVLLKVLWMCATPLGTLRFVFLAPDFLAGFAMAERPADAGGDQRT
jgi:hypothetical protein